MWEEITFWQMFVQFVTDYAYYFIGLYSVGAFVVGKTIRARDWRRWLAIALNPLVLFCAVPMTGAQLLLGTGKKNPSQDIKLIEERK